LTDIDSVLNPKLVRVGLGLFAELEIALRENEVGLGGVEV
jgi:hypothetical protein